MLKKMMALLVAISCAFGAWADVTGHLSGTDFSPLSAGSFVTGLDDNGESTGSTYWFTGDTSDFEGTIVTNALEEKFLDFESNITNPLYRTISGCWGATSPAGFVTNSIGTGLFIDTHVQFTPYLVNENHPEPTKVTAEDKLIVWVRETEVDGGANITNLIVTAGYWTAEPAVVASNYVSTLSSADVSALCAGTHRLTIKSFENILNRTDRYIMGFVVYIDQTPVQYIGDAFETGCTYLSTLASTPGRYYEQGGSQNKLFPSLLTVGTDSTPIAEYSVLSGVGYAGMGKIGDVIFDTYQTDYPSFAADDLSFDVVVGDGVSEFYYLGEPYSTNCTFSVAAATPSVTISNVTYATGYKHRSGTWHNNVPVDNQVGENGDYGTFVFANGTTLTLAGFKPNYIVNGAEFDTLLGAGGALAAALLGYPLVLNSDVVINEGTGTYAGCLYLDEGQTLVLDLNGHTIQGTSSTSATIVNNGGTLTIVDTSSNQDGKVLNSGSNLCLSSFTDSVTTLDAGIYEDIDDLDADPTTIVINSGKYKDYQATGPSSAFYLEDCIASGKEVTDWNQVSGAWYATVGIAGGIAYPVTFSTNTVVVAEYTTNITAGATLPDGAIPAFTGGAWDLDPTNAVINAATNFNYTIVASYTLTYASDHGAIPDGETYTASTPDFALAAAPTADGWQFNGWLIGSDVFDAGDTFVVADHLENTTATAIWAPISYTLTYVTDHGTAPDAVSYTVESNNFALAAAPEPGVVGVAFAGWVIGSVTNEAGATFVVADHLENTTATAAWVAVVPPAYFPQSDIDPSSPYAGRDGTPALPFVIRNLADLEAFKTYVEDGTFASSSFEVVSNITGVTDWVGVGTDSTMFSGTLNGGGKTIDVTFAAGTKYNGLFRFVNNATISNLTVNVTAGAVSGSTGGAAFVGKAYGSCTFAELKATGSLGSSVTPITHNGASMVVSLNGNGGAFNFNNCTNEMAIYANYTKVGGLVAFREGSNNSAINFNNCVNSASLNNISENAAECSGTGGLMGWTGYANPSKITVNGCASIGSVTAANGTASSIVGYRSSSPVMTGVNTVLASLKPSGTSTIGGCDWATVDGDIATFVTPVASVDSVVAYKVMQANSSPNFTLADPDASLTIDSSLAAYSGTVSVDSTLSADYDLRETAIQNGTIYSLVSKAPAGTVIYLTMGSGVDSLSTSSNGTDWVAYTEALQDVELGSTLYIKGTSSVAGYEVPQFSIVVDDTHATEQTALVVNKSAIVYFPQTAIEQEWADRNGTAALPFVIRNYADLVALKNGVANGTITNQCFEQVADIDMDGEEPWAGIGTFECRTAGSGAFEGTYDGGNYAISNVTFDQHEYNGIFASVVGGVIKNLTVDVDGFAATSAFGGAAIAGVAKNCFLTNLVATGTIIGQSSTPCTHSAAGIAVRMEGTVAYACTNRCEIWSGKGKLGGIAAMGQGDRADSLILCSNEGDIHGTKTGGLGDGGVGGIFGYQGYGDGYQAVTYTNCRNIGQVTSLSSDKTGSILGHHSNSGPTFVGTTVTRDDMVVSGYGQDGVTYGKSIGGGLVELCTQAAFETNNTYSTLWSGLTPTFEFSAPGTISFNTNLFAATAFAITATGDLDVDSTEAGGIVTFTASVPSPADPWAPDYQTDESASNKVVSIFGEGSDVANHVNTLAEYGALVAYITNVTSEATVPDDLSNAQKAWMWKSYILGANPLFDADVAVEITSLTANSEAGKWDFTVKVTEGESTDAYNVAADKVAALVKIRTSLTTGTWVTPTAGNIEAIKLVGGNLIKVTVNFGDGASGFMKVAE